MSVLFRKALADVTRRKGRTLFAILGICIGIAGFTAVNEASDVIGSGFFYSTDATAVPNIMFTVNALPADIATKIQHMPNIEKFQVRTTYNTSWLNAKIKGEATVLEINGYQQGQAVQLGEFQLLSGHWPGNGEIVLDQSDQVLKPTALGDLVSIHAANNQPISLHIAGFARTRGLLVSHPPAPAVGYMNTDSLQQLLQNPVSSNENHFPYGTEILIQTQNTNNPRLTYEAIASVLSQSHVSIVDSHWNFTSSNADIQLQVIGLLAIIRLMASLSLLLVMVIIFNIVTTLLTEQFKMIGTMKALGGTRWRILQSYLFTVSIYGVIGTLAGLIIGLPSGYQLASRLASTVQYSVGNQVITVDIGTFQVSPWVFLSGLGVGLLVPLLAALRPLWVSTRITVHETMSTYGVRSGYADSSKLARAWGQRLHWVPQTVWLGLRGLFRKPGRVTMTLLALTLSSGIFLAVQLCNHSLAANIDQGYNIFHSDLRIDLTNTDTVPSQKAIQSLQALPGVDAVEAIDPVVITIKQREMRLMGLPAHTRLYQPHLTAGHWLNANEPATVIVNDTAAQQLNLHVGDRVNVATSTTQNAQEQQATWTIIGIVHEVSDTSATANPQGRLGLAFTTLDTLNLSLRHISVDAAERVWLRARDHSDAALKQLSAQIQRTLVADGLQNISIQKWSLVQVQETGTLPIVYLLFDTVAIMVAVMGLLGLSHTLAASVLERRLEIGILRSLGAIGRVVGTVFVLEALVLALISWALGGVSGIPGGVAIITLLGIYFGPLDVFFSPLILLLTLLFILVIACFASFGPALSASLMRIRATLRYE